ncbi:MAG: enoyl-CoA hydratase/isomerase family protein [Burkholderiales bacterium]
MAGTEVLKLEDAAPHVVKVILNRPERRNAISTELAQELETLFTELAARNDLRAVILTGEGSGFCSGADLKERANLTSEQVRQQRDAVVRVIMRMESLHMPVIGMINGPAFAGGMELALGCDIRVASDRASFALTEVRNMGSFPGAGGPVRLPKLVGRGRASYIVLTGRTISAREAYDFGLVELLVPHEDLAAQTLAVAQDIAGNSPSGIAAVKRLLRASNDLDVHAATELSRALRDPLDGGHDYKEGLKAWLTDSVPNFKAT